MTTPQIDPNERDHHDVLDEADRPQVRPAVQSLLRMAEATEGHVARLTEAIDEGLATHRRMRAERDEAIERARDARAAIAELLGGMPDPHPHTVYGS